MRLETTAGALKAALKIVEPAVETGRCSIPILGCVMIDRGTMTGCDLVMQIRTSFETVKAHGKIAVPIGPLRAVLSGLAADQSVSLDKVGSAALTLRFKNGAYELPSIPAEDYPEIDMPPAALKKAPDDATKSLKAVMPFMSTEETRYYLTGVCFSNDVDESSVVVATDGHRLGKFSVPFKVDGNPILPHVAVKALARLPGLTHYAFSTLEGQEQPSTARFRFPGGELVSKLIDGTYPDWRRVIPKPIAGDPLLTLSKRETLSALSRLSYQSRLNGLSNAVMLTASGDTIVACRKDSDADFSGGERLENAKVQDWVPDLLMCFNMHYLADMLKSHAGSDVISLTKKAYGDPTVVTGEDDRFTTVLMPMRASDDDFAKRSLGVFGAGKVAEAA